MRDWERLYKTIGPLRYQASSSDCVPTTIINGLAVLLERRLHPRLNQLIWSVAVDREGLLGTGWVCCDTLSSLLTKWFERAHQDGYEDAALPFTSRILEGEAVHLGKSNPLLRCLNGGGVACLSTGRKSDHYSLLLDVEDDRFLGFDCWWDEKATPKRLNDLSSYKGMVNITWSREQLQEEIERSRWVHLLGRL